MGKLTHLFASLCEPFYLSANIVVLLVYNLEVDSALFLDGRGVLHLPQSLDLLLFLPKLFLLLLFNILYLLIDAGYLLVDPSNLLFLLIESTFHFFKLYVQGVGGLFSLLDCLTICLRLKAHPAVLFLVLQELGVYRLHL